MFSHVEIFFVVIFWDINGRKDYWEIATRSFKSILIFFWLTFDRKIDGAILVYDITNRETFEGVMDWRKKILDIFPLIPILLLGNKVHLLSLFVHLIRSI